MSETTNPILYLAVGLFIACGFWFLIAVWRVNWRWCIAGILLAGLPFPIFAVRHWKEIKKPIITGLLSLILGFVGLAHEGDLFYDKHPEEGSDRSFSQRLFGCSGMALWARSLETKDDPLTNFFPASLPRLDAVNDEQSIAKEAVYYAALAYLTKEEVLSQAVRWGLSEQAVQVIEQNNHLAILLSTDDWLLVSFRGTDDTTDWLANLQFVPVETEWGTVHKGFNEALNKLWPEISVKIDHAKNAQKPIFITGHSLGGALAVLASARIKRVGLTPSSIVTFGQPPVGYENFASNYDHELGPNLVRVVNHVDIVEKVFTPITPLQLTHSGKLLYWDTAGQVHKGRPDLLQQLRDSVCAPEFVANADIVAHGMQMYLNQLSGP